MVYVIFVIICQFKQNKRNFKKMSNKYEVYHHELNEYGLTRFVVKGSSDICQHSDSLGNSKTARNFLLNLIQVSVVDLYM